MSLGRILIGATGSGAGKTTITCGILDALKRRGLSVGAYKCGPDYIDPMFHRKVLGIPSYTLDTYFTGEETTRALLARHEAGTDISVIEGVMGYYDGAGLSEDAGSAWEFARVTNTPAILVVPAKGVGRSLLATIKGFLRFKMRSRIRGIILNRISDSLYPRMKAQIEEELGIRVVGYMPTLPECELASRHLGLQEPKDVRGMKKKIRIIGEAVDRCMDIDAIIDIAEEAGELPAPPRIKRPGGKALRVAVTRDEAFSFYYEENMEVLRDLGAKPVFFSPLRDAKLPEDIDGMILLGGYPELHAEALSKNKSMLRAVRKAVEGGLPTMAECGGFMYLHERMVDLNKKSWPMAGAISGKTYPTEKLQRFGYAALDDGTAFGCPVTDVRAHEFHIYESEDPGTAIRATKPTGDRSWRCFHSTDTLLAGFPHLFFPAGMEIAEAFVAACRRHREQRNPTGV